MRYRLPRNRAAVVRTKPGADAGHLRLHLHRPPRRVALRGSRSHVGRDRHQLRRAHDRLHDRGHRVRVPDRTQHRTFDVTDQEHALAFGNQLQDVLGPVQERLEVPRPVAGIEIHALDVEAAPRHRRRMNPDRPGRKNRQPAIGVRAVIDPDIVPGQGQGLVGACRPALTPRANLGRRGGETHPLQPAVLALEPDLVPESARGDHPDSDQDMGMDVALVSGTGRCVDRPVRRRAVFVDQFLGERLDQRALLAVREFLGKRYLELLGCLRVLAPLRGLCFIPQGLAVQGPVRKRVLRQDDPGFTDTAFCAVVMGHLRARIVENLAGAVGGGGDCAAAGGAADGLDGHVVDGHWRSGTM